MERDDEEEADEMYYTFANEYIFVWSFPDLPNHFVDVSVEAVRRDWPGFKSSIPSCKSQNVCVIRDVDAQSAKLQTAISSSSSSNQSYPSYIAKLDLSPETCNTV